jgi:hypothetical protein
MAKSSKQIFWHAVCKSHQLPVACCPNFNRIPPIPRTDTAGTAGCGQPLRRPSGAAIGGTSLATDFLHVAVWQVVPLATSNSGLLCFSHRLEDDMTAPEDLVLPSKDAPGHVHERHVVEQPLVAVTAALQESALTFVVAAASLDAAALVGVVASHLVVAGL